MSRAVKAIYENGIFRPLEPLEDLAEHSEVDLLVEEKATSASHPLAECIGILPDEDASEILRIIKEEFEQVDVEAWR